MQRLFQWNHHLACGGKLPTEYEAVVAEIIVVKPATWVRHTTVEARDAIGCFDSRENSLTLHAVKSAILFSNAVHFDALARDEKAFTSASSRLRLSFACTIR